MNQPKSIQHLGVHNYPEIEEKFSKCPVLLHRVTSNKAITLYANFAGVKKEDIVIEICGQTMTLKGRRVYNDTEGIKTTNEVFSSSIFESITVDSLINEDEITATYSDGLLVVTIPLKKPVSKTIELT